MFKTFFVFHRNDKFITVLTIPQHHTQIRARCIQSSPSTVHYYTHDSHTDDLSTVWHTCPLTRKLPRHAGVQLVYAILKLQYHTFKTSISQCRVLLETLMVFQLVTKCTAFRSARRFFPEFKTAHHLSQFGAKSYHSTLSHPIYSRFILIISSHLHLRLPSVFLAFRVPIQTLHIPQPSLSP